MGRLYTKRQELEIMRVQLENERSPLLPRFRDLGDFILPERTEFWLQQIDKPRRSSKIIDTTGTLAARTCESGMVSGITSAARPWFRLTTPDPDMADFGTVKQWLDVVTHRMSTVFLRSNFYQAVPTLYGDVSTFATGAVLVEEDYDQVIRYYDLPIGSYSIGVDRRGKVVLFSRRFQMTVRQIVKDFGVIPGTRDIDWSNISKKVKELWDTSQTEQWIQVAHAIRPNPDFDPRRALSKFKRYESVYYELGQSVQAGYDFPQDIFLREKGYDYFPVLCPRWRVRGENAWGTGSPGMITLPDIKQLQVTERRILQAIEKKVNPAMKGPTSLRANKVSLLPGDVTYIDETQNQTLTPVHDVSLELEEAEAKQDKVRDRINKGYYVDLFLMIAQAERSDMTATEIVERKEEKLLALGPVLQQLNQDFLDPNIDLLFSFMLRQGLIPRPPQELARVPLRVEYVSILAQAQKTAGLGGIERFIQTIGNLATVSQDPTVWDKVVKDQITENYGDGTGIPPSIIRPDDAVSQIRAQRQQAQEAQQKAALAEQAASAAKNLSQTDTTGNSLLSQLTQEQQAGGLGL